MTPVCVRVLLVSYKLFVLTHPSQKTMFNHIALACMSMREPIQWQTPSLQERLEIILG